MPKTPFFMLSEKFLLVGLDKTFVREYNKSEINFYRKLGEK